MNASAHDELTRLRAIAEEGRSAPLLGGWHLILWGSAMTLALLVNWAVAVRVLPWPGWSLAISWFGIVAAAWAASVILGRSKAGEPGANSVGNRVERAAWTTAGWFLLLLSVALFARASLGGDRVAWDLFAVMPPATFGAYAVALHASGVAGGGGGRLYVAVALAFVGLTAFLIGDPLQYAAAAAGIFLVSIPAGLGHLKAARRG